MSCCLGKTIIRQLAEFFWPIGSILENQHCHIKYERSILCFFLFIIFIFDMLQINIASFADDNTPYTTCETPSEVISNLKLAAKRIFDRFSNNAMKANQALSSLGLSASRSQENYVIKTQNLKSL